MSERRRRNPRSLGWLLAAAAMLAGCQTTSSHDSAPESIVLARVNDAEVTLAEAIESFLASHQGHRALLETEAEVRRLARKTVDREVFLQEASTLGIPESDEVKEAILDYRYSVADMIFREREMGVEVVVTEEEVRAFYDKADRAVQASIIVSEDRVTAEQLRERVLAGEDFGDLAQAESVHSSSSFGGSLGWKQRGELDPELERLLFDEIEPEAITPVVETDDGFVVARLDEREENQNRPPFEEISGQIRKVLTAKKTMEREEAFEEDLFQTADVTIHDSLLTQETILSDESPEALVARADGQEKTLAELRAELDLDAVRNAPQTEVEEFLVEHVKDWALTLAVRKVVAQNGVLQAPEVEKKVRNYRRKLVYDHLLRDYIYAEIALTEDDLRAFHAEHLDDLFSAPPRADLAHIVVATAPEAQEVHARLLAGEDFAVVAKECSLDRISAMHSGKVGWVASGKLHPAVEKEVFSMPLGTFSEPIETDRGFHVVLVFARTDRRPSTYEQSVKAVEKEALAAAKGEAQDLWITRLRERADVEIHEEGIRKALAWLKEDNEQIVAKFGTPAEESKP